MDLEVVLEFENDCEIEVFVDNRMFDQDFVDKNLREKYYDLDKNVFVWLDFLGICLYLKLIQFVWDYLYDGSISLFDVFGYGQFVVKDEYFYDEFESNFYFFVEECDSLQGFQVRIILFGKMNLWRGLQSVCKLFD